MHKTLSGPVVALTAALLIGIGGPQIAAASQTETLAIGATGIFCYRAPCPWRGITAGEPEPGSSWRPLWQGTSLPPLEASPENALALARAWEDFDCLLIEGMFDGTTLTVDRIAGPCS